MAAGRRGGTTSTIFRITSAKLMPIVVDVRAASDRRQLVQGPHAQIIFAWRKTVGEWGKVTD